MKLLNGYDTDMILHIFLHMNARIALLTHFDCCPAVWSSVKRQMIYFNLAKVFCPNTQPVKPVFQHLE